MAGRPLARANSSNDAVVATLHLRESGEPFVHLLHVADGFTVCADLPRGVRPGWTLAYRSNRVVVAYPAGTARFAVGIDDAAIERLR